MKKILIISLIFILNSCLQTYATTSAKNTQQEKEAVLNCEKGDKILLYYETKTDKTNPNRYLNAAKYYYYQASKLDLSNPDSLIGHARIALHKNDLKQAKNALMIALNYDELNPKTNFYLGETFYRDGEYTQAIYYYNQAYTHGFTNDYRTNYQLGLCYEKMNENSKAKTHYRIAMSLNPDANEPKQRLYEMDNLKTNFKNFDKKQIKHETPKLDESVSDEEIKNLQKIMH